MMAIVRYLEKHLLFKASIRYRLMKYFYYVLDSINAIFLTFYVPFTFTKICQTLIFLNYKPDFRNISRYFNIKAKSIYFTVINI